jgi:hypothetical protein
MPTDSLKTWPEKIYLQVHDDDEEIPPYTDEYTEGVTWCEDSIMQCEIPYIRADLVTNENLHEQLRIARATLKELIECKDLKDRIDSNVETDGCIEECTFLETSYRRRKPLAWDAARAVLTLLEKLR